MKKRSVRQRRDTQKGMAMFMALMLILILSVMGVSMAFLATSETWSGANYRMMNQARYGAEAGLNSAANFFVGGTYTAPVTGGTDNLANYTVTASPVTYNGSPVVLSTTTGASNYPVASVVTAFQSAAAGSLTEGNTAVSYSATATLLAMNSVTTAAGPVTVQTWSITADGTINGIRNATEEVSGVLERQVTFATVSAPSYGIFAIGTGCDAINLSGNPLIASYSSANPLVSGSVPLNNWGGNVGTNGNLTAAGSSTVEGSLSTPRTGVETGKGASCSSGAVNAGDYTGTSTVTGCSTSGPPTGKTSCTSTPVQLSQNVTYTTPTMPGSQPTFSAASGWTIGGSTTCASLGITAGCSGSAGNLAFTPPFTVSCGSGCTTSGVTSLPSILVNSTAKLAINPGSGTITIAGIAQSNGGQITINATAPMTINTTSLTTSGSQTLTINNSAALTINAWGASSTSHGTTTITGVDLTTGTALSMSGSSVVTLNINSTCTAPFTASGSWNNSNSSGVPTPAMFQINYGGTSAFSVEAGANTAAAIYAPNATLNITGGAQFWGSLIGTVVNDTNGANIYYDTQMGGSSSSGSIATVGNFMMDSFSWSRY